MRSTARLIGILTVYMMRAITRPRIARFFWSRIYHEARSCDRWLNPARKFPIKLEEAESIFTGISKQTFSLDSFCEEYGGVSYAEIRVLAASIQLLQPLKLFEFGTFNGGTTMQMLRNAPVDATIYTIDLPPDSPLRSTEPGIDIVPQSVGHRFYGKRDSERIHQLFGNTAEFDFSEFKQTCDWIFIDAAHSYEFVLRDTQNAVLMLRPGGMIFWHDVRGKFEGVCRVIAEFSARLPIVQIAGTSLAYYRSD